MGTEERVVTGSESASDEQTQTPEPRQEAGTEGGGQKENLIPHSRVEEMFARREAKLRQEWMEKELKPLREKYEADQQRLTNAEIARLEAMGWLKKEQPVPVTQDQLEKMFSERMEKARLEEREERLQFYYSQQINNGWREATRKYPTLASKRSFQSAVLAMYAENPQVDFMDLVDSTAKEFDAYSAERETAAQKEREGRRSPDKRVVPSGRGAGAGSGEEKGKRQTVGQKLAAKLRAMKEGQE